MTSSATLIERLRRSALSAEPERDVAVVLSEFADEGGLEPVDDPFHPARREPVTGLLATMASNSSITVTLVRSAEGVLGPPQRHGVPVALAVLKGRVVVDVFVEANPPLPEPFLERLLDPEAGDINPQVLVEGLVPPAEDTDPLALREESTDTESDDVATDAATEPPIPYDSELTSEGSSEVLPEEVYVIEADVIHRTRFMSGDEGLAIHVAIGDLATAERTRWIDDRAYPVISNEYPLTGTV